MNFGFPSCKCLLESLTVDRKYKDGNLALGSPRGAYFKAQRSVRRWRIATSRQTRSLEQAAKVLRGLRILVALPCYESLGGQVRLGSQDLSD